MANCGKEESKINCTHVFELPYRIRKPLTVILDLNSAWETLAAKMGYTATEVLQFRRAALQNQNYSDVLLTVWGSRGYKVEQLVKLLIKIDQTSAVDLLLPIVSEEIKAKAHQWLADRQRQRNSNQDGTVSLSHEEYAIFSRMSTNGLPADPKTDFSFAKPKTPNESHCKESSNALERKSSCAKSCCKFNERRSSSSSSGCPVDPLIAISMHNTLRVNYDDLRLATDQFSPQKIIGHGGYGVVYKGHWKHTVVAVKRLGVAKLAGGQVVRKQSSTADNEGFRQSMAELKTLALCRHDNILPLYGYCFDGAEYCVVYQFMVGGSLDDRLFNRGTNNNQEPLNWSQRVKIARGAACGLNYLHTCSKEPLIHGDVKPANILLDSCSEPKLGDFGLCRRGLAESGDSPLIASHVKGTLAYLPPEFMRSKILTTKLDVYSFGMVFFELATALRAYSDFRKPSNLAEFMKEEKNKVADNHGLTALADVKVQNSGEKWEDAFFALIELGFRCTEWDREKRPAVYELIDMLDEKILNIFVQ